MGKKISVVIHTYNSERFLERVLDSAKKIDEIVICDMHSTDRTLAIAEKYGCKIVYHDKCEIVEPARNFAIQAASNDWVLLVDSDEVVPEALPDFLYQKIECDNDFNGIWLARKNFMMGRFLHGDYPDYILRFFRKDSIDWPSYVHSVPIVNGKTIYAPKSRKDLALIHLANNSISRKLEKIDIYTNDEIQKRKGQHFSMFKMFAAPFFRFFKSYFLKGGFRDGKAGYVIAKMDAFYKFTTIAKIWESDLRSKDIDRDLIGREES